MQWMKNLLIGAFCLLTLLSIVVSARGESLTVRSADDGDLAFAVRRGDGAISLTEIWVVSTKENQPRKTKAYPGEPGTLFFDPAGEGLIYLERSLRREAWGSYFYGGHSLPIIRNRIWKLSLDGAREEPWPFPADYQTLEMSPSPDGRSLAIVGYRGSAFARPDHGLWIADDRGGIRLLLAGNISGPVNWSADGEAVLCRIEDGQRSIRVHVDTGETVETNLSEDIPAIVKRDRKSLSGGQSTAALRQSDTSDSALEMIGAGLDLYIRGRNALHRGNDAKAERLFNHARRAFKKLYDQAVEPPIFKEELRTIYRSLRLLDRYRQENRRRPKLS